MNKLICAVVLVVSSAEADTIYVDADNCPGPGSGTVGDPYCSIQTAIDSAVDGDEIVVAPGTYFETINFIGRAITLRSSDGAEVTTIDGTGFFHVVQCVSGEGPDTVLDGFTITGGNANGEFPDDSGGGMYNFTSAPVVTDCSFEANVAGYLGGGMYNENSSADVRNCRFISNEAFIGGGGFTDRSSSSAVSNCEFIGNVVISNGGGMFNFDSTTQVTNCTFIDNQTDFDGGGMDNILGEPVVIGCRFFGNSAGRFGGGIRGAASSDLTLINSVFSGNGGRSRCGVRTGRR